jgi:hypothetical protein
VAEQIGVTPAELIENVVSASYKGFQSECLTQPHANPITDPVVLVGGAFNRKETCGPAGRARARVAPAR